jgi:hypothetical protein
MSNKNLQYCRFLSLLSIKCKINTFLNDYIFVYFAILKIFKKFVVPNLLNLLTMKNIKRLVILITLIFFASKVLFSDFEITKSEINLTAIVSE